MMIRIFRRIAGLPFAFGALVCGLTLSQHPFANAQKEQAPPVTGLVPDHDSLSVENPDKEAAWYERVLGFKLVQKVEPDPDSMNVILMIPGYRIDLIKYKGSKRPARVDPLYLRQGWVHVAFHVDDVAAVWKQLQALRVEVTVLKDDKGNPVQLRMRDPENNEIEIDRINLMPT